CCGSRPSCAARWCSAASTITSAASAIRWRYFNTWGRDLRNKTRNVLALIASALLTGCQGHAVLPNQIDNERVARTASIVLDVRLLDGELNVEYEPRELNLSVPIAAVTAAQIAAMQTS